MTAASARNSPLPLIEAPAARRRRSLVIVIVAIAALESNLFSS
jgi:hypothetical protein